MTDHDPNSTENADADAQADEGLRLDAIEARVLGCLVEKAATTPDSYPLTLNSAVLACNQKSNRNPVMKLESGRVGQALRALEMKGLVRREDSARATRFSHTAARGLNVTPQQLAVVAVLLLRGPQTLNELLARTERLAGFDDAEDLEHAMERLAGREPPMVVRLPRGAGQREDRYMHLLSGPVEAEAPAAGPAGAFSPEPEDSLAERLARLEQRVAELEERLQDDT